MIRMLSMILTTAVFCLALAACEESNTNSAGQDMTARRPAPEKTYEKPGADLSPGSQQQPGGAGPAGSGDE